MRGYGNPQSMWALEQLVDMAAEKIEIDPLEFRLKNHRQAGEPSWHPDVIIESCALDECIRLGAKRIGWKTKRGKDRKGRIRRGVGMAIASHVTGVFPHSMEVSGSFIRLNEDGSANLFMGATELGQGVTTVMAQIAAEELGLFAGDIHVVKGDTDVTMFDIGQHASRTTYGMGNSVKHAAAEAKKKLLERAGMILEISPGDLETGDGIIFLKGTPGRKITIAEVTGDATYNLKGDAEQITGTCTWESKVNPQSFQAVFAEVEVDTRYGKVRPLRLVAARYRQGHKSNECRRAACGGHNPGHRFQPL